MTSGIREPREDSAELPPQNHYYDGWIYARFLDPVLRRIRRQVADHIPEGASVLDVGCGTGAQLIHLAPQIARGVGIELAPRMVQRGQARIREAGLTHLSIQLADAQKLDAFADRHFSVAVSTLVLHEMPDQARLPVLNEMKRLAGTLILVDWACPQPGPWRKWSTYLIERIAGRQHYQGFRSYMAGGGMPALLKKAGLEVSEVQDMGKGTIKLWLCKA